MLTRKVYLRLFEFSRHDDMLDVWVCAPAASPDHRSPNVGKAAAKIITCAFVGLHLPPVPRCHFIFLTIPPTTLKRTRNVLYIHHKGLTASPLPAWSSRIYHGDCWAQNEHPVDERSIILPEVMAPYKTARPDRDGGRQIAPSQMQD